ncbi:cubilin isoform X2 [Osmia bicornis bicornis]|uniref:cubilin isoform X2 n=1 Tax=Osmia bicornis bicornis TaxID=1437191 RepID=UPI001EAE9A65|nr:cubilin isoform X2 [Osmia bicornis bicornis]
MGIKSQWFLFTLLGTCAAWMNERPVLESIDGNLIISAAKDRNITLKILGNGYVNVNEINLLHVATSAQSATHLVERWKTGYMAEVESNLQRLTQIVEGPDGLERRIALLGGFATGATPRNQTSTGVPIKIRVLANRVRLVEDKVKSIELKLKENECSSNPCLNGGTCQDLYEGYQCHCPSNWEGSNCMVDVNECVRLLGTDLGCQNGATCINLPGSYRCDCAPGWYGIHCTKKTSVCNTQNSDELCGHGVCVSKPGSPLGYTCICDQGWQSDGTNPACIKDVDECIQNHRPCSVNPWVACRNAPGTFFCDSCPRGYTGNGYYCADIDECLQDNGGCSTSPSVQCINTMGSRMCGSCPTGYRGDGVTCVYVGSCAINNGGCHPLARCVENPALTSDYVICRCPAGMTGDGIGRNGCQSSTDVSVHSPCINNPCVHGRCVSQGNSYVCVCDPGYTGTTCDTKIDPCTPNPCRNNGVCVSSSTGINCDCPSTFTGSRCESPRQSCGGVSRNPLGHLQFPIGGNVYQPGLSCAWVLVTNYSLVLNVTFTQFNLEQSTDCKYDFLQIHDGRNAGSQMIGRFCGNTLPHENGNIVSSHNSLYFWFHSDNSISHDGFALHWNSIQPICGGTLTQDYGTISSPGSPGRYPPNRDCYWNIRVKPSKRIQIHFGQLMLEEHPTCGNDYLAISTIHKETLGIYCNHTHPPPIVVPASEAVVYFHSDSAGQDAGFQIHYSAIEGIPGCNDVYTAPSGTIRSPVSADPYMEMDCEWKIQLPVNDHVKISWSKFELRESSGCKTEFVEIFNGDTSESRLIGRYCGSNLPPTIRSSSNVVLIVFKSTATARKGEFALSYDIYCGGTFTEDTGILKSPMYPNLYDGSRICQYLIQQPPTKRIALTLMDVNLKGYLTGCTMSIYDGMNENATRLDKFDATKSKASTDPFYSTHNYMFLKFWSGTCIAGGRFMANYTSIPNECGGVYTANSGTIQTPSKNGNYENNQDCFWTLEAPPGHVVQITWLTFALEQNPSCRHDYVSVYENYLSANRELIGKFCGSKKPPILMSQGNTLTVVFHSDSSLTRDGFVASYIFIDASKVCGGHYVKLTGVVTSPNYPNKYPSRKECVWILEAPNKQRVILNVTHFELERHSTCAFDYLEIRNGGHEMSPLLGKFCGTDIPTEIISQTNQMYLKFVSDATRAFKGFSIEWDSTTTGCGGNLNAANGDIMSPNYPQPYQQIADCYWRIVVAAGSLIRLLIVDLQLEHHEKCRFDFIEISEGINRKNAQRYCGNPHPKVIDSKSNIMNVRFSSDYTNSGPGFHLKYETLCHNKIHGFHGVIESPNFPYKYEHNLNCSWIIEAPVGNKINLTFSHIDLEGSGLEDTCNYDYLEVKEGTNDQPTTELAKICDSENVKRKIHSSQHQVFVTFVTDSLLAFNGFRLEWLVDGCGGHLTRPFDSFTSPGYPSAYPENVECEWLIETDYSHSVELTIHDINTEKQSGCYFDKLTLFGGENEEAPPLIEICYSDKPVVYTSFGNKMFVKFNSDVSYAARGFNASYRSVPITCGGRYTTDIGTILSPNYPQNYPHKLNCEWLIQVDKNYLISLEFRDFDVEDSKNCTDDYVKIYDGATRNSQLLGTHCKHETPPPYKSTANEMLIVLRTDSIISAKGFKAEYNKACGAKIIVKDDGYLTPVDSYVGNAMNSLEYCTWILSAEDPADHVTVTFTHMEINTENLEETNGECGWNHIEVFEGEGMDGPSLGQWCDDVIPLPITSTGNTLTVHLEAHYDFMGHFALTYTLLNSVCGGTYTSFKGKIASPGYPNTYPLNSECIWIINNSPGNKLSLTFSEFELQQSENCDLDYLEIREDSGIGKLLSTSCGTNIEPVQSSSKLWIKFKSDGDQVAKGFLGQYTLTGGNELTGPTGQITSPLYPLSFKLRDIVSWRINVEFGWVIQIEVTDMFIENSGSICYSYLRVYDGYDNEAPRLLETCGTDVPKPFTTNSNIAYLELLSDILRQGSWFRLNWIQIPRDSLSSQNANVELSKCSEEIGLTDAYNNTYDFTSPGYPDGYESDLRCTWLITSPPGTHLVLKILTMDLEDQTYCTADFVEVYSGNALTEPNDAELVEHLCWPNATSSWIKAGNVMTVKFESDGYGNKTGFSAYVYRECGGKLEGPNGVIEMNNSTSSRSIRSWQFTCEWNVEVRSGRTIMVNVVEMSIQQGPSWTCTDNYLMLKNGGDIKSPLLGVGKYCGEVAPAPLETTGNRLYVKVAGTKPNVNFKLTYREVNMNCGGEFVLTSKQKSWEISTPNYPNIPSPDSECTWTALAPNRERITIHFINRFDLTNTMNCEREYVEVRDGGTESSKLVGRFCKDVAPSSITSTGNMLYVHYYTDVPEPGNGFKAVISIGEECGGIIRGNSGVISSPNYPFFYVKNQTCIWWIVAPADHTIKFEFLDIHMSSGYRNCRSTDYLVVSERIPDNQTITEIGVYCGTTIPEPFETTANEAMLTFKSDNFEYRTYRGFSLKFVSSQEVCGGEYTAMQGTIKSYGYPNVATRSRYCDWRIKLPKGFQVVADILDLDINSDPDHTRISYSVVFYNDFRFKSRIKVLRQNGTMELIRSSSNTMMISYSSSPGFRGFKLRYYAQAPAPCGGVIKDVNGTLSGPKTAPFNESSYFCQWSIEAPESLANNTNNTGVTLSVKVTGIVGGSRGYIFTKFCYNNPHISLTGIGMLCGNYTEPTYLRSPKLVNELIIINGTYGRPMNFNLTYQWQPCGGILQGLSHVIRAPKNVSFPINCAWHANYPDTGEMIKLHFTKLHLDNCVNNYISVRNGGPSAPEITRFCGNAQPYNITSTSNQLWIEYTGTKETNDFEFILEPVNNGCGGALRANSREISSPKFPSQYPNNAECTWEITTENGYHIGLVFVDRFNLESSAKCEKDYVQAFDWIKDDNKTSGETWKDLGKVCGRNTPSPFNSTGNRMKVVFHSNEAIQGDGFHAVLYENCGGVFEVTSTAKVIQSPLYPNFYPKNLFCNYTLVAPGKIIVVEFTAFQLERSRRDCRFDNLTILSDDAYMLDEEIHCGDDKPPTQNFLNKVEIIFKTDKYVQRSGFSFNYFLNECGGTITEPQDIKSMSVYGDYYGGYRCMWQIIAPSDKNVVLRFEKFLMDHHYRCIMDNVKVYDGSEPENSDRLAVLCGNMTEHLPVIKSTSNNMTVMYSLNTPIDNGGFVAKVLFTKSAAAGCGGDIDLSSSTTASFKTQNGSTYESMEDCHWTVEASPGKNIKFTINSMDLKNSTNKTFNHRDANQCSGDYLEIRDGGGPFAQLFGIYCGSQVPLPIISTSNKLWIRLYSDVTMEGTGVTGKLEAIDALCSIAPPITNTTNLVLKSPNYPSPSPPGTKCRWIIKSHKSNTDRLRIRFLDFDLPNSENCDDEFLQITDSTNRKYIDEGFGNDLVWNGNFERPYYAQDTHSPSTSYKYCGHSLPHDYYSYSTELEILFKADSTTHRGFKIEYGGSSCDRNYTSIQGRIVHESIEDCWFTITAPINHTISLYFNKFMIYDPDDCTKSAMQVYDGGFNGKLMATLCSAETPSPIFSTGNKLSLRAWSEWQSSYEYYDITFTTTDEGRGCGGRLFNYAGSFTSPMYPNEYRQNIACTWDISVPRGLKVLLEFVVFDIGNSCYDYNNVEVYDVDSEGLITLSNTYCGGDEPAPFTSASGRMVVKYTSSVNNVGTGWSATFMGKPV